jgi:hypothetical protein
MIQKFVEERYGFKYNPEYIVRLYSKDTPEREYYVWRPFASGFLEAEFWFDTIRKKFSCKEYEIHDKSGTWDPIVDDSFS